MIHLNPFRLHIAGGRIVHSEHHPAEKINLICQKLVVFPIFFYFVLCFLEFNPISKSNVYSSYPYSPKSLYEHKKLSSIYFISPFISQPLLQSQFLPWVYHWFHKKNQSYVWIAATTSLPSTAPTECSVVFIRWFHSTHTQHELAQQSDKFN